MALRQSVIIQSKRLLPVMSQFQFYGKDTNVGDLGSGSGKGGGAGGSVREAGGAFGKREAAQEEMYFRKLQSAQLKDMRDHLDDEVERHEKLIKEHQEAIESHKKKMKELKKKEESLE